MQIISIIINRELIGVLSIPVTYTTFKKTTFGLGKQVLSPKIYNSITVFRTKFLSYILDGMSGITYNQLFGSIIKDNAKLAYDITADKIDYIYKQFMDWYSQEGEISKILMEYTEGLTDLVYTTIKPGLTIGNILLDTTTQLGKKGQEIVYFLNEKVTFPLFELMVDKVKDNAIPSIKLCYSGYQYFVIPAIKILTTQLKEYGISDSEALHTIYSKVLVPTAEIANYYKADKALIIAYMSYYYDTTSNQGSIIVNTIYKSVLLASIGISYDAFKFGIKTTIHLKNLFTVAHENIKYLINTGVLSSSAVLTSFTLTIMDILEEEANKLGVSKEVFKEVSGLLYNHFILAHIDALVDKGVNELYIPNDIFISACNGTVEPIKKYIVERNIKAEEYETIPEKDTIITSSTTFLVNKANQLGLSSYDTISGICSKFAIPTAEALIANLEEISYLSVKQAVSNISIWLVNPVLSTLLDKGVQSNLSIKEVANRISSDLIIPIAKNVITTVESSEKLLKCEVVSMLFTKLIIPSTEYIAQYNIEKSSLNFVVEEYEDLLYNHGICMTHEYEGCVTGGLLICD